MAPLTSALVYVYYLPVADTTSTLACLLEVSWGDVDGGEATVPLVVPLARSCISLALNVLS